MSRLAVLAASTTATTTTYFAIAGSSSTGDATESNTKGRIRQDGTFKNLYVRCRTNSKTGNTPVRFRKNGANGTNVITIGSSATGDFEDTAHSDTVTAGDDVDIAYETSVAGTQICNMFSIGFETTDSSGLLYGNPMTALTQAEALTRYYFLGGDVDTGMSTEPIAQFKTRIPQIFSNLTIHISANAIGGTSTFKMRVNGADGFSSCSIGSTATGYFTDTTNWEECDADDLVCAALVTPTVGGGPVITVRAVSVTTEPFVAGPNNVERALAVETVDIAETAFTRRSAKNRALATQTITIGAGTIARIKGKLKSLTTETVVIAETRARLAVKLRPIATQSTALSDSVARVKTPFGGGPADMSQIAAKTYANKFITKV